MAAVFILCWPMFPDTDEGKYYAMSSCFRSSFAHVRSSVSLHGGVLDRGEAIRPKHYHRRRNEPNGKSVRAHGGSCPVWHHHDAGDVLLLEASGRHLRHSVAGLRRRIRALVWSHQEGEQAALVEPVEDVVRTDCVRGVQCPVYHRVLLLLPIVGTADCVGRRQHLMRIADRNFVFNACVVSVVCALTESLTIANYDNITVSAVCVLMYNYLKKFSRVCSQQGRHMSLFNT